ncbi:hypothetical protein GCM10010293_45270 [Streptomyces griseoflavus]|nr:hypothetical protein GCM10010293_45270 [Streptomyces griseoflavus]
MAVAIFLLRAFIVETPFTRAPVEWGPASRVRLPGRATRRVVRSGGVRVLSGGGIAGDVTCAVGGEGGPDRPVRVPMGPARAFRPPGDEAGAPR